MRRSVVAAERPGCISGVRKDGSIEARQCILKSWNANMVVELDLLSFRPEDHVESKPPQNTMYSPPPQNMTLRMPKITFYCDFGYVRTRMQRIYLGKQTCKQTNNFPKEMTIRLNRFCSLAHTYSQAGLRRWLTHLATPPKKKTVPSFIRAMSARRRVFQG